MSFSPRLVVVLVLVCLCCWFPGEPTTLCHAWVPTATKTTTSMPMWNRLVADSSEAIIPVGSKRMIRAAAKNVPRQTIMSRETLTTRASRKAWNRHGFSFPSTVLKSMVSEDIESAANKEQINDGATAPISETPVTAAESRDELSASGSHKRYTSDEKFTNLVFLSLTFGYALYTILSIDAGMTRGWSASEIAMRIPLDNWGAYESYLANKPIVTKSLINVIIYLLGDWLSQTAFQNKNLLEFDIKRTLRNGFIGLCFGPFVHGYYEFSDAILPPENGLVTRLQKILMDQTVYLTVKCSIYISAVGLLAGEDWDDVRQTVKDKIGGIVATAWKFWPLVHCVTYSVIPAQHRVLWVNSVDLVWNAILSSAAQQESVPVAELEAESKSESETLQLAKKSMDPAGSLFSDNLLVVSASTVAAPVIVHEDGEELLATTALCAKNDFGGVANNTATAVCAGA